ncbi:hypothetical protein ASPWEDRAFT_51875 [Aspergillus wentii DTO 134E9]|uniref:Uncharacterized protein n=1 Tax=Aspergillus wentii DTO 134E9 TaxID=1073089 RepID=A0A1L9RMD4_ASPWE|nr:uncharacterized protein ASPWEDRAFT_51875 [Aspergillus wentii DTO 134E9]KAI9929581.1 hypothetical protein MW887_001055 [Aspergillus wentii]OJJ35978.1 hypothetical protein ASPWEDRAFT_51875 [Aspergillus wentii DTO 134E9]
MLPFLSAAIHHPHYGNFQHWSLYLHTDSEDLIFEVDGEHPNFQKVISNGKPSDTDTFIEYVFLCEIGEPDIPTIKMVVDNARVDNETLEWDCQDFVLEILEGCEMEGIMDDEEVDYYEAKDVLKSRRGPMI